MSRMASLNLSKLHWALLLGTPIAIGVGYYLYNTRRPSERPKLNLSADDKSSISIDGTTEDKDLENKKKVSELENESLSPIKQANIYKNEGNVCYRKGKFDEAISFYDKAIDKCPEENRTDMAIFYQNRAASYEMLKKWNKVKEDCTRSLEYNPRYSKAYFRRAKAYEATNQLLDCLDDITATCILEMFRNNNTLMFADRILKQTGHEDAQRGMAQRTPILPSITFIRNYFKSFVSHPIIVFMKTGTFDENDESLHGFIRAIKCLKDENFEQIINACTEEIESSEAEAQYKMEALLLRGTFHLLSASFPEALQDFNTIINNSDADETIRTYAITKRGSLFMQTDQKEKCLAEFNAAEKIQPDNADIFHQRAQIYILLDKVNEALEEFEKVIRLAPTHAIAYVQKCYTEYRIALLSQDQMRLIIVITEFRNAVEKFPECIDCYCLMAQVLADQQQYEQADQFYEKAIKLAPENASLYVHRGILYLQWKADIEKAVQLMTHAIDIDSKCELAYETLGTVEVQRANLDRAVELFEEALKLAKNETEMAHLYALRNAAVAQINVTRKLGIDMSVISALAQSGMTAPGIAFQ